MMNSEAISDKFDATESVLMYELHRKSEIHVLVGDFASKYDCIVLPLYTLICSCLVASA
jgi:hypothetical protein